MGFLEVPCEVLYGDVERVGGEGGTVQGGETWHHALLTAANSPQGV